MTVALVVDFQIDRQHVTDFTGAIEQNARASRAEPGCRQFDVCQDPREPTTFLLYELYDDDAAVGAHIASAHYREFDEAVAGWVRHKAVRRLDLLPR